MFGLRTPELMIIFAIIILLFGANRIPQLGKSLGETIRGFKKAVESDPEDEKTAAAEKPVIELPRRAQSAAVPEDADAAAAPAKKHA